MASWLSTHGATITWTNTSGGNWSTTNNWSPNQIPGTADTALITASGTYTVTLNANEQVAGLTLGATSGIQSLAVYGSTLTLPNGGTVSTNGILILSGSTLTGLLSVSGTLDWTNNSSIGGGSAVTIATNAVLNIGGSYDKFLSGVLTNAGTVNWSGTGDLDLYNYNNSTSDGGIVNLAGALFNAQNDQTINTEEGSPYFNNAGTFLKSAGTNTTTINVVFTNSGVVNVASGTVAFNAGATENGTFTGAGNFSVPENGTLTLNGAVPNLILAGGTVTGVNASITNLTWSSGTLQGSDTLAGLANWTYGTIGNESAVTIATNAVLNIGGNEGKFLSGVLTNAGTVNWSGTGNLELYNYNNSTYDGGIVNLAGALFNVQNDETIDTEEGTPYFNNAGTFLKSPGTNTTTINVVFTNSGVVNVASGTVAFNAGATENGTFTGVGNFSVTGGTLTLNGAVPNLILAGGTVTGVNASITNLTWSSGTLQGSDTLAGLANWTYGTIGNGSAVTIATNAVLNISGYSKYLSGVLTNAGTVNWSGTGDLDLYNYALQGQDGGIVNLAGAVFNVQNDQTIVNDGGSPYFNNAGTFLKSAGTNTTTVNMTFTNSGVVNVASGTVAFNAGATENGTFTGVGNFSVTVGGTLTLNGAVPNLILAGGTVTGVNASITNLTWSSGTLQGTNVVIGTASWTGGSIGNGSAVTIATNAVLNISGNSTEFLSGVLTNAGTVNWSSTGDLDLYNYALQGQDGGIVNLAGALFNVQNDRTINNDGGNPYFNNAGTFLKSAGTNTTISLVFNNTGTLSFDIYSRSNYARINFPGNVALTGMVNINFNNTYSPATGDFFALISYGSETGVFSSVNLPPLLSWQTNSITYGSTAFSLTVGSIYKLAFTASPPGTTNAGAVFAPVVVQAEYLNGNPFATNGVPVTIALSSGSGVLSGTLTQNSDATGKATFNNLSINLVGPKTLAASSPPWVTPTNSSVTITPAAAAQLLITTPIKSLQKQGYTFSPAPTVQVLDQFGNIVLNSTVLITARSSSSGGGALGGATGVSANGTNGLATFSNLHYNLGNPDIAESVTPYFTSPGLMSVTNGPIQVDFVSGLITLTNGNSLVQIDPNSQAGMFSWVVDGTDQLYQHWFWLRQDPSTAQASFDQLGTPLGLSWTSANATINYLPPGLNVTLSFTLNGGTTGSHASSIAETISILNTNNSSVGLHVYDYADFDLDGTNEGDTVFFPTTNMVVQQGKGIIATQSVQGQTPNFWEASWYALTLDTINDDTPAILSDDITPGDPGDQTFAYQWDVTLGAGQTFVLNLTNSIQLDQILLNIALAGSDVKLSWPSNNAAGFNLQSSTLYPGSMWTNILTQPMAVGSNYQVTIPMTTNAQFFRLKN